MLRKKKMSPYKVMSENSEQALMIQVNADIEEASQNAARSLMDGSFRSQITYPPNHGFTSKELTALDALKAIPNLEPALRKIIADAASFPVSRVFEYIDGIADPSDDSWSGVYLTDRPIQDGDVEVDDTSYHDGMQARYWDWRRMRPTKEWKLDVLDDEQSAS